MKRTVVLFIIVILLSCNNSNTGLNRTQQLKTDNFGELKVGLFAKIEHEFSGCFSEGQSVLKIYKGKDIVFAKLESNDKKNYEALLTNAQLDSFNVFIKTLRTFKFGEGCTTVEKYRVLINEEIIEKTDEGCDWEGFSKLTQSLLGSQF